MEKEEEEENTFKEPNLSATTLDWLDLPNPIATNIILEHLEVVDYIQFSAVCKKWQLIQKEHRIRYSSNAPPLSLSFPWLSCNNFSPKNYDDASILIYAPDKQKSYNLPFFKHPNIYFDTVDYNNGWIILQDADEHNMWLCIFNPVTGVRIELPPLTLVQDPSIGNFNTVQISSPPTDPDCTILLMYCDDKVKLYRLRDSSGWKTIGDYADRDICGIAFRNNKIYHMAGFETLGMVDTLLPDPVEQIFKMDCAEICTALHLYRPHLVNLLGDLIMIITVYEYRPIGDIYGNIKDFHFYRADFSMNKWARMETLGDHALFFSSGSIFSLPADDVGCKKNTVYSTEGLKGCGVAWRAYELSSNEWTDGPPILLSSDKCHPDDYWSWFLPSFDYFKAGTCIGACQIKFN